nr:reverse transcriptase domain-containing protein [Tanacetum cinerariifolium]
MLRTFPFSLCGESKTWLNELNEGTITSWNEMREAFISRYFSPGKFIRLLNDIRNLHQLGNETLVEARIRLKEMLRICYGHVLTKGMIVHIFCHGLDDPTQGILDAGGIFLYNTPNEAFKILEDKFLLKLDFSGESQNSPKPKTVVSAGGNNINSNHTILMEKFKTLALEIDFEFLITRNELKEMRDSLRDNYASQIYIKDDTPMCEPHEASYCNTPILINIAAEANQCLFQYGENQEEAVMLRTFPFSLCGESKTWLNELNEGTITSWNEMREAFISRYFSPGKFIRLLNDIRNLHQLGNETLVEARIRLKEMLRICYGHVLTKGMIVHIFCHGLDDPTQGILDAGGIFLYNTPNEAFKILEDKFLLKLDFSGESQNSPKPKTVVSAGGNNINSNHTILMEKFKTLALEIDFEFLITRNELKEMRDRKIIVVTLVEEQMSSWYGNLLRLPIRSNIVRLATNSIGVPTGVVAPNRSIHNIHVHSQSK